MSWQGREQPSVINRLLSIVVCFSRIEEWPLLSYFPECEYRICVIQLKFFPVHRFLLALQVDLSRWLQPISLRHFQQREDISSGEDTNRNAVGFLTVRVDRLAVIVGRGNQMAPGFKQPGGFFKE